jgi:hypothetical protein
VAGEGFDIKFLYGQTKILCLFLKTKGSKEFIIMESIANGYLLGNNFLE